MHFNYFKHYYHDWYDHKYTELPIEIISEPEDEPVKFDHVKTYFREDRSIEDALINSLAIAARENLERYTGWRLINTDLRMHLKGFDNVRIPNKPLSGSVTVKYDDSSGNEQTLSSSEYSTYSQERLARIDFHGDSLPDFDDGDDNDYPVRIEFTIGYGSSASDVPERWKSAIKLLAMIYWRRDVPMEETQNINPMEISVLRSLIEPYIIGRFH